MKEIVVPVTISKVLEILHKNEYEAYVVGGCVRDSLLGYMPKDWDVTTNALPEEIIKTFENYQFINNGGLKHGTVTIRINGENVEITSYRTDGTYEDHRHPDNVKFTSSLKEDLSRRDFTVNAMAFDGQNVIDYFNGKEDLKNKCIRAVGNPDERFNEDALRILRGIRFACRYNFNIEENTLKSMILHSLDLKYISKERIQSELNSMIYYEGFFDLILNSKLKEVLFNIIPELKPMYKFEQKNNYHPHDLLEHSLYVLKSVNQKALAGDYKVSLAALLHDIGKYSCFQEYIDENGNLRHHYIGHPEKSYEITLKILNDLKYSNKDIEFVSWLVRYHDFDFSLDNPKKSVKKLLNLLPENLSVAETEHLIYDFCILREADKKDHINMSRYIPSAKVFNLYKEIEQENSCFKLKDLAVNGYDLIELGYKGREIGDKLNLLLNMVVNEEILNKKEILLDFIKEKK